MVLTASQPLRGARQEASQQSLLGLSWLNFWLAGLLTGFGPFVAVYLADQQWSQEDIGLVFTIRGLAGLACQIPGGELVDATQSKRLLVALGVSIAGVAALIFAAWPSVTLVYAAEMLEGVTGGFLGPAVTAMTLGLVPRRKLGERLGRNQRFASAGGVVTAMSIGLIGYFVSDRAIFVATAVLALPTLATLSLIRPSEIQHARASGAVLNEPPARLRRAQRGAVLWKDRRFLTFAGCAVLFQFANASLLPLVGEVLAARENHHSALVLAALIVVPQVVVVALAPWVGRRAETWGRRPLLLLGFGVLPLRALLMTLTATPSLLIAVQVLDGISAAAVAVMTPLVIADITRGTGRFNFTQGVYGTLIGIGAAVSTAASGFVVQHFGAAAGFLGLAAVALAAVVILWIAMPETKPARYA